MDVPDTAIAAVYVHGSELTSTGDPATLRISWAGRQNCDPTGQKKVVRKRPNGTDEILDEPTVDSNQPYFEIEIRSFSTFAIAN